MSGKKLIRNSTTEFLIFTGQAGEQSIEARYEDETVWLSQKLMAELFGVDVRTVNEHLKNIFASNELASEATIRKFRIVQQEGNRDVKRLVDFYNLDAIIAAAKDPDGDMGPGPRGKIKAAEDYLKVAPTVVAVAREIEGMGRAARVLQFDIGDRAATAAALEADIEQHGCYYGVVCNAGIAADNAFPALTGEQWLAIGVGFVVSALSGLVAIGFLLAWLRRRSVAIFSLYRADSAVTALNRFRALSPPAVKRL